MSNAIRGWLLVLALASIPAAGFAASPRIQRSLQFRILYPVPKSGTIVKVELWMTADDGANWSLHRAEEQLSGKMPVKVQKDGRYGIKLVGVRKGQESDTQPPKNTTPKTIYLN